ncbi:M4 family metallopeptidase [Myxococcaceae bacterium GXIMD 01537]
MTNRLLKTFCAAWLGLAFAGCDTAVDTEGTGDIGATEEKDSFADVQSALSAMDGARVVDSHKDGTPYFIKGNLGRVSNVGSLSARSGGDGASMALSLIAPAFRLNAQDLVFKRGTTDSEGNQHLRYAQTKNGIEVKFAELVLHVRADGTIFAANGSARDGQKVSSLARISGEAAAIAAVRSSKAIDGAADGASRLVYVHNEAGKLRLAYEQNVKGAEADGLPVDETVYVDAQDGSIVLRNSHIHTAINRAVYTANNGTSLPGTLKRSEGGAAANDVHVDENYDHLGTTYNCYQTLFARDSYNNAGAQLRSTVHYSSSYVNAFWNGSQMVYGDGNGVDSGMLGRDLDVTVHELTHAVTSSESNLVYSNESGALNEAWSDIFAAVCESWTRGFAIDADIWKVGEDIWTPGTSGDALRYMNNPTIDGSSTDYYPERYTGSSDNGGVHWNSGIANLAFQLLSEGGTHPRAKTTTVVPAIGVEKAARIFYKANTDIFTSSTTFAQAKTGTEQAASQLGYDQATIDAVTAAWQAVGVGIVVPPPPTVILTDGVAKTGLSGSASSKTYYKLTVPAGQATLTFTTSGGTGDADMYVRFGSAPDSATYDCRPYASGNAETCTFNNPAAGDWYVMLNAYSAYSGLSLLGDHVGTTPPPPDTLVNGVESASYSGAKSAFKCWTLTLPAGKTSVVFNQVAKTGNTGDADLYVRLGSAPTTSTYACRSQSATNTEACTISNPGAGTWYACSYGYSAYTNVAMKGTY